DKRWKVREELMHLYWRTTDKNDDEFLLQHGIDLIIMFQHAVNLFGSEVIDYMNAYGTTYTARNYARIELDAAMLSGQAVQEHTDKLKDLNKRFSEQFGQMKDVFNPYLQLHSDQGWVTRLARRMDLWVSQE